MTYIIATTGSSSEETVYEDWLLAPCRISMKKETAMVP